MKSSISRSAARLFTGRKDVRQLAGAFGVVARRPLHGSVSDRADPVTLDSIV
jgi:hypothetical protein